MKTFWQIINEVSPDPSLPPSTGGGISSLPGGGGMGGGLPTGGGMDGLPPMGGGLGGGMGGLGGGMDPMSGGQSGAAQPNIKVKPYSVWSVLSKILDNEPIKNKKISGQTDKNMIQNNQLNQVSDSGPSPETTPPV